MAPFSPLLVLWHASIGGIGRASHGPDFAVLMSIVALLSANQERLLGYPVTNRRLRVFRDTSDEMKWLTCSSKFFITR
jgi:hypothetical protein